SILILVREKKKYKKSGINNRREPLRFVSPEKFFEIEKLALEKKRRSFIQRSCQHTRVRGRKDGAGFIGRGAAFPVPDSPLENLPQGVQGFVRIETFAQIDSALAEKILGARQRSHEWQIVVEKAQSARDTATDRHPVERRRVLPHAGVEPAHDGVVEEPLRANAARAAGKVLVRGGGLRLRSFNILSETFWS